MSFIETPRFPVDIKYGSSGGPSYSTDVVVTGGGIEYRNSNWSTPLYRYNVKYDIRTRTQALEVFEFFQISKGRFGGFRVKDFWDYRSTTNGVDAVAVTDQTIGTGDGVEVDFQLIKTYAQGSGTSVRNIKKPISGTVLVEVNGVLQTESVDYTIDYATGIITFTVAVTNTHVIKAGYEFDVPCRFDTDDLSDLFFTLASTSGSDTDIVTYPDIPLIEDR